MSLIEIKGDLFSFLDNKHLNVGLAHCVSQDLHMSKGIAVLFKDRFGNVESLKQQNKKVGEVATLVNKDNTLAVFYLITKEVYWGKPTYDTLTSSLLMMREIALSLNIKTIAMPQIGCGLDRLDINKVKSILQDIFPPSNISIIIYSL